jgi:hypothetical protein
VTGVAPIILTRIPKSDPDLRGWMAVHYSAPKGFVGRQLIYKIFVGNVCYGATVAGSATRHLPGRTDFFGQEFPLNNLVNNTFFHIEKQNGLYPFRNFSSAIVKAWRSIVMRDWPLFYGSPVNGFETLVELPRTGQLYYRDGWTEVGMTKGYTCKRVGGVGTDGWSGKRVWDVKNLRPKRVFVKAAFENIPANDNQPPLALAA